MVGRDWRAVGERVAIERARRWARPEFAKATGLSVRVLEDLETGKPRNYSVETLGAVERALRWEPGSCYRIADGLQPRYVGGPELRAILDNWDRLPDQLRRVLADMVERYGGE